LEGNTLRGALGYIGTCKCGRATFRVLGR
jgi:hypothetical protein